MATLTFDYNDEKTWDLFREGRTKGIFQLESNLGRAWSKRLQPTNLEELTCDRDWETNVSVAIRESLL